MIESFIPNYEECFIKHKMFTDESSVWTMFAAAALNNENQPHECQDVCGGNSCKNHANTLAVAAAQKADSMLAEYQKRFGNERD